MHRAWAQLLRIPNVFTAPPDVIAGAVLALGGWPKVEQIPQLVLLCLASACLYMAGMILNDVFDIEVDRRERPFRPLPSGRIRVKTARSVGVILLLIGVGLGVWSANESSHLQRLIPLVLALSIVLYDGWAKNTLLGPWVMGTCRGLNVLMGTALAAQISMPAGWAAATIFLYVAGVTIFARGEAAESDKWRLLPGSLLISVADTSLLVMILVTCTYPDPPFLISFTLSILWWIFLDFTLRRTVKNPGPAQVQRAIKTCIFGLVVIQALHASTVLGVWGLLVLLFLPPSLLLGKWVYST
jgi:4-hydroxybenzoate polyprenyltransferase